MIELDLTLFCFLFFCGLFAGAMDAIAGGGGLITLPVLIAIGLPPHIALGTNKLQSIIGTSAATYYYFKHDLLSFEIILKGLVLGVIGASLGAISVQLIDASMLRTALPYILSVILLYTLFKPNLGLHVTEPKMRESLFYGIFSFVLGFYDGFLGPGTGSFWMFAIVFFLGYDLAKATAYTKAFNLKSNLVALICFMFTQNINYKLGLLMGAGQLLGGHLGSRLVVKKGAKLVRPLFLLIVTLTILSMFWHQRA